MFKKTVSVSCGRLFPEGSIAKVVSKAGTKKKMAWNLTYRIEVLAKPEEDKFRPTPISS